MIPQIDDLKQEKNFQALLLCNAEQTQSNQMNRKVMYLWLIIPSTSNIKNDFAGLFFPLFFKHTLSTTHCRSRQSLKNTLVIFCVRKISFKFSPLDFALFIMKVYFYWDANILPFYLEELDFDLLWQGVKVLSLCSSLSCSAVQQME